MTRREIREAVFKGLFLLEFHEGEEAKEQLSIYLNEENDFGPQAGLIEEKIQSIRAVSGEIDEKINGAATDWTTDRMNKVDLMLMRLAYYEMKEEGLDAGIAVNEAVELAKEYGSDGSPAFVNGILGTLARGLDE